MRQIEIKSHNRPMYLVYIVPLVFAFLPHVPEVSAATEIELQPIFGATPSPSARALKPNILAQVPARSSDRSNSTISKLPSTRPKFSDYPVKDIFRGRPAPMNPRSHRLARVYRTVLTEGAKHGPNFAGHFTFVSWGCGTNCQLFAFVDAKTGEVWPPVPQGREIPAAAVGFDFRLDSRLLIVNPMAALEAELSDSIIRDDDSRYYVWQDNKLKLIFVESPTRPIRAK